MSIIVNVDVMMAKRSIVSQATFWSIGENKDHRVAKAGLLKIRRRAPAVEWPRTGSRVGG